MLDTQKRWCYQSTASLLRPIVITTPWRWQHSCQYHPVLGPRLSLSTKTLPCTSTETLLSQTQWWGDWSRQSHSHAPAVHSFHIPSVLCCYICFVFWDRVLQCSPDSQLSSYLSLQSVSSGRFWFRLSGHRPNNVEDGNVEGRKNTFRVKMQAQKWNMPLPFPSYWKEHSRVSRQVVSIALWPQMRQVDFSAWLFRFSHFIDEEIENQW